MNIFSSEFIYLLLLPLYCAYELYFSEKKIIKTKLLAQSKEKRIFQQKCERRRKQKEHYLHTIGKKLKEIYARKTK